MPTIRKRHMVSEAEEVGAALERVRQLEPVRGVNLAELEEQRGDAEHRAELRESASLHARRRLQ